MKFFLLLSFLLPQVLMANISGTWIGSGSWSEYQSETCQVKLIVSQSIDNLSQDNGEILCGQSRLGLHHFSYKIGGGDLLDENDEAIGSIDKNQIFMNKRFPDGSQVDLVMKIEGSSMNYEEVWYDEDGEEMNYISGNLKRNY